MVRAGRSVGNGKWDTHTNSALIGKAARAPPVALSARSVTTYILSERNPDRISYASCVPLMATEVTVLRKG